MLVVSNATAEDQAVCCNPSRGIMLVVGNAATGDQIVCCNPSREIMLVVGNATAEDQAVCPQLSRQDGFSLVEVLIATLVLSVGILGVAAMQMVSFQTSQSAYARSRAVYLAQDILDRMRANVPGYTTTAVYDAIDTRVTGHLAANLNCVTAHNGCTPRQMAQQDVREWTRHFSNVAELDDYRPTLPNGRGVVSRVSNSNDFTVTVSWDERDFDARGEATRTMNTRSLTLRTTLN